MANEDLIDDRISVSQIKKAVDALHAYESKKQQEREETELITGKEPNIWLNVTVKQVAPKNKIKPFKIPIVHPLVDPRTASICLITKDPQREFKELLESHNIKFISRVVGISKLKGKFKSFEARRLLLKENGLFLADDRVIPLLPKLLGSKWFEAKKQPIPVSLTRKDLKGELERAISSTYMHQNNGTCTSIKIGTLSHKPSQVVANIQKAISAIAAHIPGDWDNIQSFFIKTNTSVSLPIWSCNLDERWSTSGAKTGAEVGAEEDGEKEKKGKKRKQNGTIKGKKGPVVEDDDEEKKGKKREQNDTIKSKKSPVVEDDNDDGNESAEDEGEESEEKSDEEEEEQPRKKIKSGKPASALPSTSAAKPSTKPKKSQSADQPQKLKKSAKPASSTPTLSQPQLIQKVSTTKKPQTSSATAETVKPKTKIRTPSTSGPSNPKAAVTPNSGLTSAELKQKRAAAGPLVGKKQKVISGKGANNKSAKAKILGKKALQA